MPAAAATNKQRVGAWNLALFLFEMGTWCEAINVGYMVIINHML
jgi:hypothetical protein